MSCLHLELFGIIFHLKIERVRMGRGRGGGGGDGALVPNHPFLLGLCLDVCLCRDERSLLVVDQLSRRIEELQQTKDALANARLGRFFHFGI